MNICIKTVLPPDSIGERQSNKWYLEIDIQQDRVRVSFYLYGVAFVPRRQWYDLAVKNLIIQEADFTIESLGQKVLLTVGLSTRNALSADIPKKDFCEQLIMAIYDAFTRGYYLAD